MTQIPEGTQFIGISPDVSLVQKRSQLINDESAGYTAFQIAQAGGLATVTDVTYDELVALIDASSLVVGGVYRITDFQTLHEIPNTTERNDTNVEIPIEVLVCIASSTNTLFSQVQSEDYPDDIIYYTVDNTAWKDLQIDGQKGCITLRIDTLRNIQVGNGDWRNFIVRRWAVDLTAYGRGAIRWLLWGTSVGCGCLTTGANQTLTALDTNLYDPTTNPDGYRDFRLYGEFDIDKISNIYIKERVSEPNVNFPMPNFFIEKIAGYAYNNFEIINVNIKACGNVSFTSGIKDVGITSIRNSIFADCIDQPNMLFGFFDSVFIVKYIAIEGKIGNMVLCTIWENIIHLGTTYQLTLVNLRNSFINFTGSAGDFSKNPLFTIENCEFVYAKINKQGGNSYILRNFAYTSIINAYNGYLSKNLSAYTTNLKYDPSGNSTIETTLAAISALALSSGTGATVLDMFAGVINLTGSGTVNIDTLTRLLPNNFPVTLKPESGLTISIDQNNVANGFVNSGTITANGTNGEVIVLLPIGDRWKAS